MEGEIIEPKIKFKVINLTSDSSGIQLENALNDGYKIDNEVKIENFVIVFKYE